MVVLQSIIIPKDEAEMYFRGGSINGDRIILRAGERLTFDAYYNGFCYTKYREYTTVTQMMLLIESSGSISVSLMCYDGKESRCIAHGNDGDVLIAILSELPENGILYPEITAEKDSVIYGGCYSSECAPEDINVCISVCTFRREQYVLRNIELLRSYDFSFIRRAFFVDNGNTLDFDALSDNFISVLPNRNFGGSGGFTRGLIEAKDGGYTHVILMDDDVEFHPEALEQMTVFVSLLKKEYKESWFSAGMIPLDKPNLQFELGAEWNGKEAVVHKNNVNICERTALVDNLVNPDVQYGGWWTLLMPVSVTDNGYPYPFFIKFDDVEYGLRKAESTEIITMNGIAVRHEAFDRKKNFILDYYNLRNELFVNALYNKYGALGAVKRLWYEVVKHLALYRYDNIPLVLKAAKDYIGGLYFLKNCDEERLNSLLIASAPKLKKLSDIPEWSEEKRCDDHVLNKKITIKMLLTLGGHLIPSFALKKEINAVPLSRTGVIDCYGKKAVIQYQLDGDNGIYTHRDFAKMVKYGFLCIGMSIKLFFSFNRTKKQLITRKDEITSYSFWKEHLQIK